MKNSIYIVFLTFSFLASCSQSGRLGKGSVSAVFDSEDRNGYCDSLEPFSSAFISKVNAAVYLGDNQYNARVSVYYIPDSLFYMSAVNSGFEIIRIGVLPDSIVYINRLDKEVYVQNTNDLSNPPPILFRDLEYLFNRNLVCDLPGKKQIGDSVVFVNRSVKDIKREMFYRTVDLIPFKFEFFQKKTGEYVVGMFTADDLFVIYSNYIVKDLRIEAKGGVMEYNRVLSLDLNVNRKKYNIYYF
jgi:hypothetical protein